MRFINKDMNKLSDVICSVQSVLLRGKSSFGYRDVLFYARFHDDKLRFKARFLLGDGIEYKAEYEASYAEMLGEDDARTVGQQYAQELIARFTKWMEENAPVVAIQKGLAGN